MSLRRPDNQWNCQGAGVVSALLLLPAENIWNDEDSLTSAWWIDENHIPNYANFYSLSRVIKER